MKIFRGALVLAGAVCFLGLSNIASANPIGTMNLANCGGGGVTVTATTIVWSPVGTVVGTGCIDTGLGTNLVWSAGSIGAGVKGNIMNLSAGGGVVDHFIDLPAPPTTPALDFVLDGFGAGSANTNCAGATSNGASCSLTATSPFILTFNGISPTTGLPTTTIAVSAFGTVSDANGPTQWAGGFSTQVNQTPGQVQATFASAGFIQSTYSGQFSLATVPEPVTTGLIGSGLIALAFIRRRKSRA